MTFRTKVASRIIPACTAVLLLGDASFGQTVPSFSLGANFTGTTYSQNGVVPPDTMGSVGPNQVAMLVNLQYIVAAKDGSTLASQSLNSFWQASGQTQITSTTFDPRLAYDPGARRWYATSVDFFDGTGNNHWFVGASKSANLADGWNGLSFQGDALGSTWIDFPRMGFDRDALYLVGSRFTPADSYAGHALVAIPKQDLIGSTPTLANRTTATLISNQFQVFQPAAVMDNTGNSEHAYNIFTTPTSYTTQGYPFTQAISRAEVTGNPATGFQVNWTPTNGTTALVPRYLPGGIYQPDGLVSLDVDGDRLSSRLIRRGNSYFGVQCAISDNLDNNAIRFFELDATTFAKRQEQAIIMAPGGLWEDVGYPSLAINDDGTCVIGFTASGSNAGQYPSAAAIVGSISGTQTTFSSPFILKQGTAGYVINGSGRNRWGDYSSTDVDPADPNIFWTFQEWSNGASTNASSWAVESSEVITYKPGQVYWKSTTSGSYSSAGRWLTGSTPTQAETAIFSREGMAYQVDFAGTNRLASIEVRQGSPTFSIAPGATLEVSSTSATSLLLSPYQGTSHLVIRGGGTLSTGGVTIASGAGSDATLSVQDSGTRLRVQGNISLGSSDSAASLNILSGATLELFGSILAAQGSTVNITGNLVSTQAQTIPAEATLKGRGLVESPVQLSAGAILAPGGSIGMLSVNQTVTLAGTQANPLRYEWEVASTAGTPGVDWDFLKVVAGSLDLTLVEDHGIVIDVANLGADLADGSAHSWSIAQAPTLVAFRTLMFDVVAPGAPAGTWRVTSPSAGNVTLGFTPVPLPSAIGLGLFSTALLGLARRRRL